ncbi:MAG TPA: DUF116 domain-containing protein [Nitrospirota bacterium]|nr:DUF116 domain-containing protein [Nitrospirota bacterium]
MTERRTDPTTYTENRKDRKLGDEWMDWKGDSRECEINENLSTFLSLALGVLIMFIMLLLLGWFMVKPRFQQMNPLLATGAGWVLAGFMACLVISAILEGVLLRTFKKSLFPYGWIERLVVSLLPKTIWLGKKFGISKDRIGNSFIKMHNFITMSFVGKLNVGRVLILLPRCLKREARERLMNRLNGGDYKVYTAAGGEEAREAIRQYRPTTILAIACERDLMGGIKDVADKIPVIAVPNKRPEGPCKNTDFILSELDEALRALTAARS